MERGGVVVLAPLSPCFFCVPFFCPGPLVRFWFSDATAERMGTEEDSVTALCRLLHSCIDGRGQPWSPSRLRCLCKRYKDHRAEAIPLTWLGTAQER